MRRTGLGLVSIVAALLAGCSAPGGPTAQDAPPGGVPRQDRGAYDVTVQQCLTGLMLSTGMRPDDEVWYQVPADTTFADVVDHYTGRLGEGWSVGVRDAEGATCHQQTWTNGRLVGTDAVLAVVMLDEPVQPTDSSPFRVVVVARQG